MLLFIALLVQNSDLYLLTYQSKTLIIVLTEVCKANLYL